MTAALQKNQRNQSMECCRMIASFLVVVIHVPFPGALGRDVFAISLFAVPMFLAISGYFSYGADAKTLARRLGHIIRLNITIDLIHIVWNVFFTELQGGSTIVYLRRCIPDPDELLLWLFLQQNAFLSHLWYLAAMGLCYGLLWVYVRSFGEEPVRYHGFYLLGAALGIVYLILAILLPMAGVVVPVMAYGNGWFYALPMFTLGIFLREHGERLRRDLGLTDGRLLGLFLLGMALCLAHKKYLSEEGVPMGMLLEVPALMLLLIAHPTVPVKSAAGKALIGRFGVLSTAIYLLHVTFRGAYDGLLRVPLEALLGAKEPWLRPLIVYALTLLGAIAWERVDWVLKKRKKAPANA